VQRPLAAPCISIPVQRPLWKDHPSWFLIADDDRVLPPDTQRFMAERMGARTRTRPVDHAPMVTAPDEVADIIRDAVRDVAMAG
jgi:pimeloyl-ACP methyl ester carboxylesterase